ncbi:MAG: PAS domain-containing protein, partial [Emcibacteraceae bacterium]|nr:PAS domain-containing protein [Emcibacteraceae bacterium]
AAKKGNGYFEGSHRLIRPSGEIRVVEVRGKITFNQEQKPIFIDANMFDITERKHAQSQTQLLENRLLEAQRIGKMGNWNINYSTGEVYWADETLRIAGFEPGSIEPNLDLFFNQIVYKDDVERVHAEGERVRQEGGIYDVIYRINRTDGEIRYINSIGEVEYDENNEPLIFHGVFHDITEAKITQDQLAASKNFLNEAQRIAHFGSWHWYLDSDKMEYSDELIKIFGLENNSSVPTMNDIMLHIHEDYRDYSTTIFKEALQNGDNNYQLDIKIVRPNGEERYAFVQAEIKRNAENWGTDVIGTVIDITDRIRAEKAAISSEERLIEAQRIGGLGHWNWELENNKVYWSDQIFHIYGYKKSETDPSFDNFRKILHPDDAYLLDKTTEKAMQSGDPFQVEHRLILKSGDIKTVIQRGEVTKNAKGIATILNGTIQDITDLKAAEEDRIVALNQAQEANKAKSQFLATMSHELRTPLNAIIGFSEMMTNKIFGELGSDRYTEYAGDIVGSSRHLLNLVNDILDLSEIESGKKNMDIKHISLRDVLDDCQFIITKLAEDKQISCAFNIPKNMTLIFADDRALKQIFINIMNNSVKFTENGGKISLNAQTDENSHIIIIEDNGQGIPEDKMETVLNPFSRVENDPYRTQEGKGLGLAIVKSLMSLHNGTIEIESEYGIGTKVILTFPNKVMN